MPEYTLKTLFLATWALILIIRAPFASSWQRQRNPITDNRSSPLDTFMIFFASLGYIFLPFSALFTPWLSFASYQTEPWVTKVGLTIYTCALWLLWRSHLDLGPNFSPKLEIQTQQTLIMQGTYGVIRHPMYASFGLVGIAQLFLLENWIAGPAGIISLLPLYFFRIPNEERMMLDHFGEAYQEYLRRTKRVIPRFW